MGAASALPGRPAAMQACSSVQRALQPVSARRPQALVVPTLPHNTALPSGRPPRRRPLHVIAAAAAEELQAPAAAAAAAAAGDGLNTGLNTGARRERSDAAAPSDGAATLRKGTLWGALSLIVGNTVGAGM